VAGGGGRGGGGGGGGAENDHQSQAIEWFVKHAYVDFNGLLSDLKRKLAVCFVSGGTGEVGVPRRRPEARSPSSHQGGEGAIGRQTAEMSSRDSDRGGMFLPIAKSVAPGGESDIGLQPCRMRDSFRSLRFPAGAFPVIQ